MLKIEIQTINDIIYSVLKNSNKSKGSPDIPKDLTCGGQSKWLIWYAEKYQRSYYLRDWLISLFNQLYFSTDASKEAILIGYIQEMVFKLYHLNFTSLVELYEWARDAKARSIYKDITEKCLSLVIKTSEISIIIIESETQTLEEELHDYLNQE